MLGFVDRLFRSMDAVTEAGSRGIAKRVGRRSVLLDWHCRRRRRDGAHVALQPGGYGHGSRAGGKDRRRVRILALLRLGRLPLHLLRRHDYVLSVQRAGIEGDLGRNVPEPADSKEYLISYNDCCGISSCGRCLCNFNLRERPGYRMGVHNDINWCMANEATNYHCTVAAVVGLGQSGG
jgi:methylamine dehydrogenase light chain